MSGGRAGDWSCVMSGETSGGICDGCISRMSKRVNGGCSGRTSGGMKNVMSGETSTGGGCIGTMCGCDSRASARCSAG